MAGSWNLSDRLYWGYIGIMEKKKMETIGIIGVIKGYNSSFHFLFHYPNIPPAGASST